MKSIPKQVKEIADREACNSITYVGKHNGKEVYGIGEVDENGMAIPTGLPVLVLWDGETTEVVADYEALSLLSKFV